ncbi:hypothetical protein RvY_05833-2 [Ramazzottius varieornatus]|nr:hypothetical protein RvY_05833-2 [Ramazzottius varieornatus]
MEMTTGKTSCCLSDPMRNIDGALLFVKVSDDLLVIEISSTLWHQTSAVFSVLERYNWNQFSVITENTNGMDLFLNGIRRQRVKYKVFKILHLIKLDLASDKVNVTKRLKVLENTSTRVILLYATRKSSTIILEAASNLGLTGPDYMWICMQKCIGDISEKNWPPQLPPGILGIDIEMTESSIIRTVGNAMRIYGHALDGLMRQSNYSIGDLSPNVSCEREDVWSLGRKFHNAMRKVDVPLGTSNHQRIQFSHDGTVKFAEFNITNLFLDPKKGTRFWTTVGSWNTEDGLQLRDIVWPGNSPVPPLGRPEKYHLNIVTLEEEPYVIMKNPEEQKGVCESRSAKCRRRPANWTRTDEDIWEERCCSGLCIDLLQKLGSDMGFTFDLYRVEDGKWGAKTENGWNGLIADLVTKKADLALSSIKITQERQKFLTFSIPYLETGIAIVVAKREGVISPTAFLEPFDYLTWIIIAGVCIQCVSVFIFIFEWMSPDGLDMQPTPVKGDHHFSLFRVYWLVFAIFFGATCPVTLPRSLTSKYLTTIWAICSLAFVAVYTANLATFMITRDEVFDIKGIEDRRILNPYSNSPPFRYGTMPFGSTSETIRIAYPQIYNYMQQFNKKSVADGIEAVKSGQLDAFLYDAAVLDYRVGSDQDCKILTVGSWFATTGYAVAFPQGSHLAASFDDLLMSYQRDGYLEQIQQFWLTGACKKKGANQGRQSHALGIKNFMSAFIFLGLGLAVGIVCLMVEWICYYCIRFGLFTGKSKVLRLMSVNITRYMAMRAATRKKRAGSRKPMDIATVAELYRNAEELKRARAETEFLQRKRRQILKINGTVGDIDYSPSPDYDQQNKRSLSAVPEEEYDLWNGWMYDQAEVPLEVLATETII